MPDAMDNMQIEEQIRQLLDNYSVPYEMMACDPELADTVVFCEHYGYSLDHSANTLLVKAKTGDKQQVACVLLATTRLDVNKTVRKRMGVRRLSFASAEETEALTGMALGGVTPLALPETLPLWVDSVVMQRDYVILGGGSRASKIKVSPQIFTKTPNTSIVEGLAQPLQDC